VRILLPNYMTLSKLGHICTHVGRSRLAWVGLASLVACSSGLRSTSGSPAADSGAASTGTPGSGLSGQSGATSSGTGSGLSGQGASGYGEDSGANPSAASSTGTGGGPPDSGSGGTASGSGNSGSAPANDAGSDGSGAGGNASDAEVAASSDGSLESACGDAVVCDDFESYTSPTNLTPWVLTMANASLMIDSTHVYSGKQAVKFTINAGANNAAQMTRSGAPLFPVAQDELWGRMMVYMTNLPAAGVHYDNIQGDPGTTMTPQYRIGGMGTILLNYQPNDCYDHPSNPMPHDMWTCWQWVFDGSANTIEFYIGGQLQAKVVSTGGGCTEGPAGTVWTAPTFGAVRLGWVNYQATTAVVDMWIDDVALGGDAMIACPAMPATAR